MSETKKDITQAKDEVSLETKKVVENLIKGILDFNQKNKGNMDLVVPKDGTYNELGVMNLPEQFSLTKVEDMIGKDYKKINVRTQRLTGQSAKILISERR